MSYTYNRKKQKKSMGNFIIGLFVGILAIFGISAGIFFGIPSVKASMANKLVNESSIYKDAVGENETLKKLRT